MKKTEQIEIKIFFDTLVRDLDKKQEDETLTVSDCMMGIGKLRKLIYDLYLD